ncbi:hypothetical protein, partial [Dialister invisus]|uniref:hypothetical protein n=1 Tax=Dialister invisus TaxID=218538 RepID=UPI000ABF64E6
LHSIFLFKVFNADRYLGKSSNGKNRDWVSLLVYKEVAGEAGQGILAWGSDAKGWNGCVYLFIRRQVNHF